jgi:hypothetical protein
MNDLDVKGFVRGAGLASLGGGVLGLGALVTVLVLEADTGGEMMSGLGAMASGWAAFVAAALLSVGLLGVAARYLGVLSAAGRVALAVLGFATAITVGATATLALVVPHLLDRMPGFVADPPAVVPPTFILSGLASGVCAIIIAVSLRRAGVRGIGVNLLFVGAVLTMVPLPARFFMLAFAVAALLLSEQRVPARQREPEPVA